VSAAVEIGRHGAEVLDELQPLWLTLKNHHGACTPGDAVHDESRCDVVELAVLSANEGALRFYERLGFTKRVETLRRVRQ
jgi:ribosomal protein S18 acetylase RimI-like enzyme